MASDFWKSDQAKAQGLLDAISKEVFKSPTYHKSLSGNNIAVIRGRISQLTSLITHMQQSVSRSTGALSHPEIQERAKFLSTLNDHLDRCQDVFYKTISGPPSRDSESTNTSDDHGHLDSELGMIHEQDRQLDYILGTASNLKEIGYDISEELQVHCRLLEEIESKEDAIFTKHQTNERLLKQWMSAKNSPLAMLWGLVVILFIIFVYVLVM